jgi:hypothetical protein
MTHGSLRQHEDQGIEWKRDRRKNHVVWQLGPEGGGQEFPRDVVGWDIVAQEQGRLAAASLGVPFPGILGLPYSFVGERPLW